jgi:DNA-binding HxlR family transcriptional regulator
MRGYGQFCPVAIAAEILAERWTPLVLRELLCGSHRFNDLHRGVPLMSRTLLAQRLRELESAGIIERRPGPSGAGWEYYQSRAGEEIRPIVERLGEWGQRWAHSQFRTERLDAGLLVWDMHRRIRLDALPPQRVVVRLDFRGLPRDSRGQTTFWLVMDRGGAAVCLKDPGFSVDLVVSADAQALTRVWMGALPLTAAIRSGLVELDGPRILARAFPTWLGLSSFATVERPRAGMT